MTTSRISSLVMRQPLKSLVRIVSSTTPGSVLLAHGFTHDNSVPILFSTPQARSQQQTEILIQLLKKLAPADDIRGVLYLVDSIHLIPKWRPINYSFVCILISPLGLIFTSKFFCFLSLLTRQRGLINMQTKE